MKKTMKRFISVFAALGIMLPQAGAYDFAAIKQESDQNVIEVEAESFVRGSGFEIIDDETASGGKCIVGSGDRTKEVEIDIDIPDNAKRFVIYAVHKGNSKKSNLSYMSIDHFESYALYDREFGKWNETRMFYGELDKGTYTVKLASVRAGQKIDKLIIKYEAVKSDDGTIKFTSNAIDKTKTYIPGNAEFAELDVVEAEEKVYGSYMFEVEEGNKSDKTLIGEDPDASGGKYWYAPTDMKLKHLTEHTMTDEIHSRFKFEVTHKGSYAMWIRYNTPVSNQKSTWFGIDNENYLRLDDGQVRGWKWTKVSTLRYLDTGWHTLDIKYRQPGHKIDCVILTDVSNFSAQGLGSLPGEPIRFDSGSWDIIDKVSKISKFKANNYRCRSDCQFVVMKNDILVPAPNLFNIMAVEYEEFDDYCIAKNGRTYLKWYMDSERVITNGVGKNSGVKAYREQGAVPMVSVNAVKEAFGIDYEYDEAESTLHVFYDYEENYREAEEGEITVTPGERFFTYEIPCDDPDAKIEVWFKYNLTDTLVLSRMNHDNMNTIKAGGIDYKAAVNQEWRYWRRAMPPYYKDGAFHGSEQAQHVEPYDIKVKIVKDGKEDIFVKRNAFRPIDTIYDVELEVDEYAPDTGGELMIVPTFENISYYIDCEDASADCEITYRKKGTEEWKKAYKPIYGHISKQFRGSIVKLDEDTEYEVRANITGASASEKTAFVRTWTSTPPVAKVIPLSEIYSGNGPLLVQDIQGTEDGWIKIVGDEKCNTVNGTKNYNQAVLISNCKYMIFEGITVRGGDRHCVNVHGKSEYVRITNCDIAEWGHEGILHEEFGGFAYMSYFHNNLAGVHFYDVKNVVIERCYIHDCDIRTNAWDTDTYKNVHPKGGTGIQMLGKGGMVIRYNDVIGSDKHRYNDVMEGTNNRGRDSGSIGQDADVYGNMMIYSEDDNIELDGGQMNVRVYHNRMEQSRCGVSTAPNRMGPTYIFNNLITNLGGTYNNASGSAIKAGGDPSANYGMQFFFNNTMDSEATGPANINYSGSSEYHSITRNNIFVSRKPNRIPFKSNNANERDSNDYDLYSDNTYIVKEGDAAHAVIGLPTYVDLEGGNYHLADGSLGMGAGEYLDNFTEVEKPDMGAYQSTSNDKRHMPFRPVDMYADRTYEHITDGIEREITIHIGDIGEGHTYSLVKNRDFGWLDIISDAGTENVPLEPNSTIKFKIKGDLTRCEFAQGKGLVLFRLENGFSVPVTVYCTK